MIHLTEKPVELAARAIEYARVPARRARPVRWSGSTLIAARRRTATLPDGDRWPVRRRDRRAVGVTFTGRKAKRIPAADRT